MAKFFKFFITNISIKIKENYVNQSRESIVSKESNQIRRMKRYQFRKWKRESRLRF